MDAATLMPLIFSGGQYASPVAIGALQQKNGNPKDSSLSSQNHSLVSDTYDAFSDEGIVPSIVPTYVGQERHSSESDYSQLEEMYPVKYTLKNTLSTSTDSGSTTLYNIAPLDNGSIPIESLPIETFQDLSTLIEGGTFEETFSSLESLTCSANSFVSSESSTSFYSGQQTVQTGLQQPTFSFSSCMDDSSDDGIIPPKKTKFSVEQSGEKGDKYLEQRRKNNIASRYSRLTRKQRQKEMEEKAAQFEQENKTLRVQIKELEELKEMLKGKVTQLVISALQNKVKKD